METGTILNINTAHIIGFVISFILSVCLVPLVRLYCLKKGFVDIPNNRKIHKAPIPRLGGVAIWTSTIVTFVILILLNQSYPYGNCMSGILIGGSIMFVMGLVDDVYNLSPKFKLIIQIGASLIAFLLGVRMETLFNPFGAPIALGMLSLPITILWLVGFSNAMNFIDGVDGLAGTVSTISAVTLSVVVLSSTQPEPIAAIFSVILAGSMMGFLAFNYHPAKIFMGDSGALFAGFALASLAVTGVIKTVTATIFLPIFILAVPLLDISYSTFRRLLKGKSPFVADSEHIHHKLIQAGLSHNSTVLVFIMIALSAGAIAVTLVGGIRLYAMAVAIILPLMLILSLTAKYLKLRDIQSDDEQEPLENN